MEEYTFEGLCETLAKAADPATPPKTLATLIIDLNPAVSETAAKNPSTPATALFDAVMFGGLVNGYTVPFRSVASNQNACADLLKHLSGNDDVGVRNDVARNVNTAPETLMGLAKDAAETVVMKVAANPNTPVSTLDWLSVNTTIFSFRYSPSPDVACRIVMDALAHNPNSSVECLLNLVKAGYGERVAARATIPLPVQLALSKRTANTRQALAQNPACDQELLSVLARDKARSVRTAVATNANCPASCLRTMAQKCFMGVSGHAAVLHSVIQNPNCPSDVFVHVAHQEKSFWLNDAIISNPACPSGLRQFLRHWDVLKKNNLLPEMQQPQNII